MVSYSVTIVIVVWILILFAKSMEKNSKRNYKNEIVSLGVLGTFIGIAIGLFHFDATHIKESMPFLLEGLKTAFITSGVGIFVSIIISIFRPNKIAKVTLDNIGYNQLKIIETLEKSLDQLSKKANTEMVGALEKIVKDFNNNLTEQFGDNFKKLNNSIDNMVRWQSNYKTQVKEYEESLKDVMLNLEEMSQIKSNQEKNIDNIITNLSKSSDEITQSLKKSADVVEESLKLLLREANGKL
jgi:methyl-accepting chemotaxis protein